MIRILKGDATNVNGRNLTLNLPTINISSGYVLYIEFLGIVTRLGDVTSKTLQWNYTSEQTMGMPFGIHFATLKLKKQTSSSTFVQTVSNTIPIEVSDCVPEVYETEPSINANITLNGVIPQIDIEALTKADTTGDVKAAFNALLAILKSAARSV